MCDICVLTDCSFKLERYATGVCKAANIHIYNTVYVFGLIVCACYFSDNFAKVYGCYTAVRVIYCCMLHKLDLKQTRCEQV
jgi:hypothetical protein